MSQYIHEPKYTCGQRMFFSFVPVCWSRALQQRDARALQQRAHSKRFSSSGEAPCSWSGVWRVPRVRAAQAAFALEPTSVSHAVVPLSFRFAVVRLSFRSAVVLFSVLAPLWCFCLVALM